MRLKETGLFPCAEFLLMCQEKVNSDAFSDPNIKIINLGQGKYWKSIAYNHAVRLATSDKIVLLDSDRVMLRQAYYTHYLTALQPKTIIAPSVVLDLQKPTSDDDLLNYTNLDYKSSTRYTNPLIKGKTAFSGNTILFKEDYLAFGGMDENMHGYGYHDNDATLAAARQGMNIEFVLEPEFHLWHPKSEHIISDNERNRVYFCKKWGLLQ
jgi:predicted glycosyltransferase involved in capsule biosynthesis